MKNKRASMEINNPIMKNQDSHNDFKDGFHEN